MSMYVWLNFGVVLLCYFLSFVIIKKHNCHGSKVNAWLSISNKLWSQKHMILIHV